MALQNDFPVVTKAKQCDIDSECGKIRLWFKYNSLFANIVSFPDVNNNKWIRIPPNFMKTIKIHDIATDQFRSNIITVLVDKVTEKEQIEDRLWYYRRKPKVNVLYTSCTHYTLEYDNMLWISLFKVGDLIDIRRNMYHNYKFNAAQIEAINYENKEIIAFKQVDIRYWNDIPLFKYYKVKLSFDEYELLPFNPLIDQKAIAANYILESHLSFYEEKDCEKCQEDESKFLSANPSEKPSQYYNLGVTNKTNINTKYRNDDNITQKKRGLEFSVCNIKAIISKKTLQQPAKIHIYI
eukprot:179879_1